MARLFFQALWEIQEYVSTILDWWCMLMQKWRILLASLIAIAAVLDLSGGVSIPNLLRVIVFGSIVAAFNIIWMIEEKKKDKKQTAYCDHEH